MIKILSRRPQRRTRFLITFGSILFVISFVFLFWMAELANTHSKLFSVNWLRILCGLDLIALITGGVTLFWGISIWFRNQVFKG